IRLVGFGGVRADAPTTTPNKRTNIQKLMQDGNQQTHDWLSVIDMALPKFTEPLSYVRISLSLRGCPILIDNDSDPSVTCCPHGDLFAIWYSTKTETGR